MNLHRLTIEGDELPTVVGSKVMLDGVELKGVTALELKGMVGEVWTVAIQLFVQPDFDMEAVQTGFKLSVPIHIDVPGGVAPDELAELATRVAAETVRKIENDYGA